MSPTRPLTKARAAEVLELARMDIAELMARTFETQRQLHTLIGITGELYEGITHEEAPEIEIRGTVVKAS
jgi:hypothetical protein